MVLISRRAFVHLVDDDASFRTATERCLRQAGYEVQTHASAEHLLHRLPQQSALGCILLDVRIPGMSGPELQDRLRALGSTLPIIFLTGHPDIPTTVRAIKAGAHDFLIKPIKPDDLLRTIEHALARRESSLDLQRTLDTLRTRIQKLTPRERQVFDLVVRGVTNRQAAGTLGCTERTIKAHRQRIMRKLQVQSVAELVSFAERAGAGQG